VGSPPFSATTLPPFDPPPEKFVDKVIAASREQFTKPRAEVEKVIDEWQRSDPAPELSKPAYEFNPDGSRRAKPRPAVTSSATPRPAAPRREDAPLDRARPTGEARVAAAPTSPTPRPVAPPVSPRPAEAKRAPEPERPPLHGSTSLRDALAAVAAATPAPPQPQNLKDALGTVAPAARATPQPSKPASLPQDVLQNMLAVDETGDTTGS
jgi:hypothetical protein